MFHVKHVRVERSIARRGVCTARRRERRGALRAAVRAVARWTRKQGAALLASEKVTDGGDGMLEDHARSAVTHGGSNAFAHFGSVAVVLARLAGRFHVHFATTFGAQDGVRVELRTGGADGIAAERPLGALDCMVRASAVHGDHLRDRLFLASAALFDASFHIG